MNSLRLYTDKPKPKRKHPERNLQALVCEHLRLAGAPNRGLLYLSIPNEGKRSWRSGGHLKRMGMKAGAGDLLIILDGKAHFLELKVKGNDQSDNQVAFEAECKLKRIPYAVATGIDEALSVLRGWGALASTKRQPQKVAA